MASLLQSPEHLTQKLEEHKKLALTANLRQGREPTSKPTRAQLEQWYAPGAGPSAPNGGFAITQTVIGFAYPPSTTPLGDLEAVDLSQLRLETHHRGKVLVVQIFGHTIRVQAVQTGIEDHLGNVDRLTLYNADPDASPGKILSRHSIFAIKEPYYKLSGDGGPCVRIDHPSDLVLLDQDHPLMPKKFISRPTTSRPAATDLKARGNTAVKNRNWSSAAQHYTKALAQCAVDEETMRHDLLRNRALANIHLRHFEQALEDAKSAILEDNEASTQNTKAHYRAGIAAYQLGDYLEARDSFEQARKLSPADTDTEREYKRTISRVLEQQIGRYDLMAISTSVDETHRNLDHASFTKHVEVQEAAGRGRGLFAKKSFISGELILLEKAHCVVFEGEQQSMAITMNLNINTLSVGPHSALLVGLVQGALRNPKQGRQLLDLWDAGYQPKSGKMVDDTLAIDVFQTHQILDANVFGCPALRTTDDLISGNMGRTPSSDWAKSCGIWLLASRMNHACDENASRAFIGDLMVVHATRDIAEGEEIFISYKRNTGNHEEMQKALKKWGFQCTCSICSAEEKTKHQLAARSKLVHEANDFFTAHAKWIQSPTGMPVNLLSKAEDIYARAEKAYDPTAFAGVPRLGLCQLGLWIARAYLSQGNHSKTISKSRAVLRDYGYFSFVSGDNMKIDRQHCHAAPEALDAALYASNAYQAQGKVVIVDQLRNFAREMYRVLYGTMRDADKLYGAL